MSFQRKVALGVVAICGLAIYCQPNPPRSTRPENPAKIKIVTTIFPLYDFARNVGRERVEVSLLLPPGVEAHAFEPRPSDLKKIAEADLFIYTGKFMEPWALDVLLGVQHPGLKAVEAGQGIGLMKGGEEKDGEDEHGHHHEGADPHVWMDFANAVTMVDNIARALIQADPDHRDYYGKNARDYENGLRALDARFKTGLSRCAHREFVHGGHYAFGYLARRYHLQYLSAQGFVPDSEPTPRQMIELTRQIRGHELKYVYYEEMIEPRVADILSRETGAKLLLLHGGHNVSRDELDRGVTFLELMENNLQNLKMGLECQP
ncbi:MAG: metal ABC transporter substrate-binding protein [Proteobacteria bacterium]|nr:metal ABC transporter substrate-binding protein [Pseudomonadota bacterium]